VGVTGYATMGFMNDSKETDASAATGTEHAGNITSLSVRKIDDSTVELSWSKLDQLWPRGLYRGRVLMEDSTGIAVEKSDIDFVVQSPFYVNDDFVWKQHIKKYFLTKPKIVGHTFIQIRFQARKNLFLQKLQINFGFVDRKIFPYWLTCEPKMLLKKH